MRTKVVALRKILSYAKIVSGVVLRLVGVFTVTSAVFLGAFPARGAAADPLPVDVPLRELLKRVLEQNESLQMRLLEMEIDKKKYNAERGVFEPQFFATAERDYNKREQTTQEQVSSQFLSIFSEKNNLYSSGIESLTPSGGRVRLAYNLTDFSNNLQERYGTTNSEYRTFFGLSAVQPLLRNAGPAATLAGIRLAAMTSEIAYQEYRRQMMQTISSAEAAYWNLYFAQEQIRFFNDSVKLADTILRDNQERVRAGKSAEAEVLEAASGLALRRSKLTDAQQTLFEAISKLTSLYSSSVVSNNTVIRAVDEPQISPEPLSLYEGWSAAFEQNPDYLIQRRRIIMEGIRVAYAQNQLWPQLDLKASYGLNGLGRSPADSWDDIQRQDFASWSVGVELRVPIGGNIKARNERDAAKLRQQQALIGLKEIETQIVNTLDSAVRRVQHASESVTNYQSVARYSQNLLDSQLASLEGGKIDSRAVLETEAAVFEAKNAVVQSLVQYRRALIELDFVIGNTLRNRGMDFTQRELEAKTALLVRRGQVTDQEYQEFRDAMKTQYESKVFHRSPAEQEKAVQTLRRFIEEEEKSYFPKVPGLNLDTPQGAKPPGKEP